MNDEEVEEVRHEGETEGRYANYFKVGHNALEFVLDFGQFYAEGARARIHIRIITSPVYAKVLSDILRDSIRQYVERYGAIPSADS